MKLDIKADKAKLLPILLAGGNSLQTSVLSHFLQSGIDVDCQIVPLVANTLTIHRNQLLLIDCNVFSCEEVHEFLSCLVAREAHFQVALLNAKKDKACEDLAHWPQVNGVFYESNGCDHVVSGIQKILNQGHALPDNIVQTLLSAYRCIPKKKIQRDQIRLTKREQEVLLKITEGHSNQEVAKVLHVSEHTVKSHLYNIFKKVGVANRTQACNWTKRHLL